MTSKNYFFVATAGLKFLQFEAQEKVFEPDVGHRSVHVFDKELILLKEKFALQSPF